MKNTFQNRNITKWFVFILASLILIISIWVSNQFVAQLKKEEKSKMEIFSKALELLNSIDEFDSDTKELLLKITSSNEVIPVVLLDEEGDISFTKNIDSLLVQDKEKMKDYIFSMKIEHEPIAIKFSDEKNYIYYKNSDLLTQLRYYPIILIFIVFIFIAFVLFYFRTIKNTEQSYLWVGMAKETAHQIGTPLSSLMGWVELLRLDGVNPDSLLEIEKDVDRLNHIVERFSKIGSTPELSKLNIIEVTNSTVEYLRNRISKGVEFNFYYDKDEILVDLNSSLYSWVIENLTKNAVDAMQNKGVLTIMITEQLKNIIISVQDSGPGIPSGLHKDIFQPGFTTKKRGWGLGLSLAKRIIEDYHKGEIYIAKSEKETGTEIRIILRK